MFLKILRRKEVCVAPRPLRANVIMRLVVSGSLVGRLLTHGLGCVVAIAPLTSGAL